jgi:ATP-dependent DNA helicase RecG
MNDIEQIQRLNRLIALSGKECRWLEFKSNHQDPYHLGKYISALSNGACLDNQDFGYLYFGVEDNTLELQGTTFEPLKTKAKGNQDLELFLRQYISPKINFTIEEFHAPDSKRFVVFVIPAAKGEPTKFQGTPYVRVDSSVTELTPYVDWVRQIYNSTIDWSAVIVPEATIADLDEDAIAVARKGFYERFPDKAETAKAWDDATFLDKAKITINGNITRTALLLLGKEEATHYLGHIAQIVWRLRTPTENAGNIFTIPFLLSTSKLNDSIRNYRIKIFPNNSLIPAEVWKYDNKTVLEAMHNCIAHQDYLRNERIVVTEETDQLVFENAGSFFDGDYEQYIEGKKTPKKYRNSFLANAMVNLKMIDTQGYGIHEMFMRQRERFLPMPDYDRSDPTRVKLIVPGHVIDAHYSLLLMERADLNLTTAVLLDSVQKKKPIGDKAITKLRKLKLIEGRKPNVFISQRIAGITHQEAEYTDMKGLDDKYYQDLIIEALTQHGKLKRADINKLLLNKLPSILSQEQKLSKIGNMLTKLRRNNIIFNDKERYWRLVNNLSEKK